MTLNKLISTTKKIFFLAIIFYNCCDAQQNKDIFLCNFLKEGIQPQNMISQSTRSTIESIIVQYTSMEDYATPEFYKREESKIKNCNLNSEQIKIWYLCLEKLNFEHSVDHDQLESNWRYPYHKLRFATKIMNLYSQIEYGDSWQHIASTPVYLLALYMYFLPWKERKKIYDEIDNFNKNELSKSNSFKGKYMLVIPAGMVKENSPELKIIFTINNYADIIIETLLNNIKTENISTMGIRGGNTLSIEYEKDGKNKKYIITCSNNNYTISGPMIEELNSFSKEMPLTKLSK